LIRHTTGRNGRFGAVDPLRSAGICRAAGRECDRFSETRRIGAGRDRASTERAIVQAGVAGVGAAGAVGAAFGTIGAALIAVAAELGTAAATAGRAVAADTVRVGTAQAVTAFAAWTARAVAARAGTAGLARLAIVDVNPPEPIALSGNSQDAVAPNDRLGALVDHRHSGSPAGVRPDY